MSDLAHLQVEEDIAFEDAVVEYQVDEVVLRPNADVSLARHEAEATPQFHQHFLEV